MGCTVCAGVCPTKALTMVPQEQEAAQQEVFNYMVEKVSAKADVTDLTVKGSQFKKPLLEFSGSDVYKRQRYTLRAPGPAESCSPSGDGRWPCRRP